MIKYFFFNLKKLLEGSDESERQKVPVPKSQFISIENHNIENDKGKFTLPAKYIHCSQNYDDIISEYDMDSDDENFLENYNQNQRDKLPELHFEKIVSRIEKEIKAKVS